MTNDQMTIALDDDKEHDADNNMLIIIILVLQNPYAGDLRGIKGFNI